MGSADAWIKKSSCSPAEGNQKGQAPAPNASTSSSEEKDSSVCLSLARRPLEGLDEHLQ